VRAQKPPEWNPKLWSQPLFLGAMLCVGMYQFYNVRHRSKGNGGGGGALFCSAAAAGDLKAVVGRWCCVL
jgi:hypothetical protein